MANSPKDKKAKILEVAIKLFTRQGYHETKLDEVAQQADIAKGTLYLYFKNKEDLFLQCLVDGFEKSMALTRSVIASPDSIRKRLLKLLEHQADLFRHNGPLIQQFVQSGMTFSSGSLAPKQFLGMLREKVELVAGFFREGIEVGEFSERFTPTQMALIYQQIFDLNLKFQMFKEPPVSPEGCREILFDLFKAKDLINR